MIAAMGLMLTACQEKKQPYNIIRTLSFPLQRTGTYRSKVEYIKVMEKK